MAEPATAPGSAEPILRLRGMARRFGGVHAVFGGLTVEDNVYLAVLGVRRGHLRPVSTRDGDEMREHLAGSIGHQCPNR